MNKKLREGEALYRTIVEDQMELICRFLPDGTLTFVNEAYCRYFDKQREELIGQTFMSLIPDEDRGKAEMHLACLNQDNPVGTMEHRVILPNGEIRWQQWSDRAIFDEQGHLIEFQSVGRDITDYKQTEETLQQRNRELTLLSRASQAFISTLDLDQVLITVLEEVCYLLEVVASAIWLIDTETDELVCRQVSGSRNSQKLRGLRLPPGEGIAGWVAHHSQSLIVADAQTNKYYCKETEQQTGLVLHSILTVPLRARLNVIGVIQVVDTEVNRFGATDLMLVESLATTAAIAIENARLYEQTRRDAETKAMLLAEVNHRVQNNLATIIGLLSIERNYVQTEDRAIMKDLINRVRGLATVHKLLSASDWSPLPLAQLTERVIYTALQALPPDKQVLVKVTPSRIELLPKQANHLALVINELVTNTLKYALSERQVVHITVRIALDDDVVVFEFQDDGPGYPEETLHLERHNVGLYLVQAIVCGDLRGELALRNDPGAVTTIRFAIDQGTVNSGSAP